MKISPRAGQQAQYSDLIEVTRLINDYYSGQPNSEIPEQRIAFGTSGRPIAERYCLNLKVVNDVIDPTFRFMTLDWDGKIRMDPSSSYAMQSLIGMKDNFDVSFACDTDHDRHGIGTRSKTEQIYKIYAESFKCSEHLAQIEAEAETFVGAFLSTATKAVAEPHNEEIT
jgi:hypothetical protein